MRTTLDLPDDLMRRAKIAAVERRTTLRDLVGAALERELSGRPVAAAPRRRAKFPIFGSSMPGKLRLTSATIRAAEDEEDLRRHGRSR